MAIVFDVVCAALVVLIFRDLLMGSVNRWREEAKGDVIDPKDLL